MKLSAKILLDAVLLVVLGFATKSLVQAQLELWLPDFRMENKIIVEEKKGEEEVIVDESVPACGLAITDRDGYEYPTVQIGDQCWMAANLKTRTNPDGTCINGGLPPCEDASEKDNTLGRTCYDNDEAACDSEGALYTYAGIGGTIDTPGNQGICPDGWHIPTHDEFTTLERSVCTSGTCETDFPYDTTTAGGRGTDEAISLKVGGCSGFNAVLTGRREADGVTFTRRADSTWFWSSQYALPSVYRRLITASSGQVFRDAGNLNFNRSQSLRCVRDVPVPSFCGEVITDRDGYNYKTIRIGDQCWMAENLKTKTNVDGTCINGGSAPCADASATDRNKGRACYGNIEANCDAYGALYTYSGIAGTLDTMGNQGICPDGWHIPTHNEFTALERAVCTSSTCETDFPYNTTTAGARGTNEGTSLKVGGCSRFNAILGGRREADGTTFAYMNTYTWFWSSQYSIPSVYRRLLTSTSGQIFRDAGNLNFNRSQSLRCVKDI